MRGGICVIGGGERKRDKVCTWVCLFDIYLNKREREKEMVKIAMHDVKKRDRKKEERYNVCMCVLSVR